MNAVFTMVKEMQMPPFHAIPEANVQENGLVQTLLNLNAASYVERIALSVKKSMPYATSPVLTSLCLVQCGIKHGK